MRAFRALAVAALVALDVGAAAAQSTRGFKDSWFWGLKGGAMTYSAFSDAHALAPIAGIDWMITRSQGGLYVSFDHALFDQFVFVNDSVHPEDACPTAERTQCRRVDLDGMHRFTMAGMLFPLQNDFIRPYIGFGVSFSHVARAEADTLHYFNTFGVPYRNSTQFELVHATIQQFRTTTSPVFMLGTQIRLPLVSIFGQATVTPANQNFLLSAPSGSSFRMTLEAGARYNIGSSIDRMR